MQTDSRFEHVMALSLDPSKNYREGVIRCITSRTGNEGHNDQIDRSVLYKVKESAPQVFVITDPLVIKNQNSILKKLLKKSDDFLGLEDPDIWIDEETSLIHLYFTLPIKNNGTHIGHAVGKDLDTLEMTLPVLTKDTMGGAKELSIAPLNTKQLRYNLVESSEKIGDTHYSTVRIAIAEDMGAQWKFGNTVFHPHTTTFNWIKGHASPGPLFPRSFIDIGPDKLVGVMNGCEANTKVGGKTKYGEFSVGLFIYDYENGHIDWVSPEPWIQDSEKGTVRPITFASQFVETELGKGILYAHVDDSFVRAYEVDAETIKTLLPTILTN